MLVNESSCWMKNETLLTTWKWSGTLRACFATPPSSTAITARPNQRLLDTGANLYEYKGLRTWRNLSPDYLELEPKIVVNWLWIYDISKKISRKYYKKYYISKISSSKCQKLPFIWPILDNFWFQFQVAGTQVSSCSEAFILVMDRITATAVNPCLFDNRNRHAVVSSTTATATAVIFFKNRVYFNTF